MKEFFDDLSSYEAHGWTLSFTPPKDCADPWEARCSLTPGSVSVARTKGQAAFMALASALSVMRDKNRSQENAKLASSPPVGRNYDCELLLAWPESRKLKCSVTAIYDPNSADQAVEITNCHVLPETLVSAERLHIYEQVRKGGA